MSSVLRVRMIVLALLILAFGMGCSKSEDNVSNDNAAFGATPSAVQAEPAISALPATRDPLDVATREHPAVIPYDVAFATNPDGSTSPRMPVDAFGVQMGEGVRFNPGTSFSGVDIAALKGHDLQAYRDGGMLVIVAIRQ
jgi:hypothetical protein